MSVYYSDEYLTNHDYLQHYGKKGMKWGVINAIESVSNGLGGGGGIQDLDTAIAEKEKHCKQILARMEGMDKGSPIYNRAKEAYYKELNSIKGLQNKKAAQGTKEVYKKLKQKAENDSVKGKLKNLQKDAEKALGVKHELKRVDSKGMSLEEYNKHQHDSSISGKLDNAGKAIKKKAKKVKKAAKDTVKKTTKEVKSKAKEAKKKVDEWLDW